MIDFEEALRLIRSHSKPLHVEERSLDTAMHRVLARDVKAISAIPRFDASAVDGYALRAVDTEQACPDAPVRLLIQDTAPAGIGKQARLKAGHAVRIFTGAMVPPGADSIVMQEHVQAGGDGILLDHPVAQGLNIRYKGEEFRKGERILEKGCLLTPPVLGMLATLGATSVQVHAMPRVAIIVTGSELAQPGEALAPGRIYDSNSTMLNAAVRAMGLIPQRCIRVEDKPAAIRTAIRSALKRCDILITAGGVSVGDFDFVASACANEGVRLLYETVAIKPGKPNVFGTKDSTLFFGLPGNPVAALLSFHLLVRPAIEGMLGLPERHPPVVSASLTADCKKKAGRVEFLRAVLVMDESGQLAVTPVRARDSHMLSGLAQANCLIRFPRDQKVLNKGDMVSVSLLQWSMS
jgi:molybdopterin molybdotransferase